MRALRLKKHVESDSLQLSGLEGVAGKDVEIIILVEPDGKKGGTSASSRSQKRVPGSAKGMMTMADDFQKPLDDREAMEFYK